MIGATIFAVVFFVFLIAICIGFIILQIRLSKMDSKWPGLVLPAITLLLSLVAAITVFARADIGAYGNMWNVRIHRVPVQQRIHHRAGRHLLVSA